MSNSNNIWSVQHVYPCLPLFEYVKRAIGGFQQSFSFYMLCSSVDPPLFLISNSWQIGQRARIASEIRFFSRFWYVRFSHFSVNFFYLIVAFLKRCKRPVLVRWSERKMDAGIEWPDRHLCVSFPNPGVLAKFYSLLFLIQVIFRNLMDNDYDLSITSILNISSKKLIVLLLNGLQ